MATSLPFPFDFDVDALKVVVIRLDATRPIRITCLLFFANPLLVCFIDHLAAGWDFVVTIESGKYL